MNKNVRLATLGCGLFSACLYASSPPIYNHPFYAGLKGGFGSTTWQGLVPHDNKKNIVMNISAPIHTKESGAVAGVMAGYELTPYFAIEANYLHFPKATVVFDINSLYAFEHDDHTRLESKTDTVGLMGKVMLIIPNTTARLFSSFGAAYVHRKDEVCEQHRLSPTFGAGFNVVMTEHTMAELAFNYTAGYGESELNPVNSYVPFLYAVTLGLVYRI